MKTAEELKEFRGTKGEWAINHWEQGGSGVTCKGESNGITHYTGDNVCRKEYRIVSNLHPNSHNVEHSFEGAHIAEIAARSEESLANAQLIAAAPDLLEALMSLMDGIAKLPPLVAIDGVLKTEWEQGLKAINKALGK
jgi:hypothetical protein